jgi:hypothetical protein
MKKYTLLYIAIIYILYGLQVITNDEINPLYFDLSIYYNIFLVQLIFGFTIIINYIFKENVIDNSRN